MQTNSSIIFKEFSFLTDEDLCSVTLRNLFLYKHVLDMLATRHFSYKKCQECTWEQQMAFTWKSDSIPYSWKWCPPSTLLILSKRRHCPLILLLYFDSTHQTIFNHYPKQMPAKSKCNEAWKFPSDTCISWLLKIQY